MAFTHLFFCLEACDYLLVEASAFPALALQPPSGAEVNEARVLGLRFLSAPCEDWGS